MADENEVIDPDDENTEGAKDGAEDFSNTDDDTKNQSSGNESDDDGEFDAAAEFAALEQKFDEGAVTRADFDAFKASVQRGLGQVSRLQSNVDRAAQSAVDPTDVEAIGEQVALLTEALTASVDPSDPLMARLAAAKAKQAATEATRAAVAKIRAETEAANPGAADDDGTGNQMSPARKAELNEASSLAKGYAKAKGVDIPEAAWAEAMTKSNGDTAAAVTTLYEIIDGIAKPDTTQIERTRRKAAGSTGNPPKNGKGGSSASLTFEALSQMSEAEVGVLLVDHEDEINRVLAKGPDA